jgi:HD-GYP domain-containing protein (c-di-GMP phosphodiesterase class II)
MQQLQVAPQELMKGMYVAELDRPWTETHFLFQGFRLEREEDIRYMRDNCAFVVIDVDKGTVPPRYKPHAIATRAAAKVSTTGGHALAAVSAASVRTAQRVTAAAVLNTASRLPPREEEYADLSTVEDEFVPAGSALKYVQVAYSDFMESLRTTRSANTERLRETVADMEASVLRNPDAMLLLCHLRSRDSYSYRHAINSSVLAIVFGRHLGLRRQQIHDLGAGMLLADVGKVHLPKVILDAPRKLSETEYALVRRHVDYSVHVLENSVGVTPGMLAVVQHHHERFNGSGYPKRLAGDDIPLLGRIAGIVDTYDAMTNDRSYAKGDSPLSTIQRMYAMRDIEFHGALIEQFIQALGLYPVGTLVLLNSAEVGVVIGVNRLRRLLPKIMLLLDSDKRPLQDNAIVNLAEQQLAEGESPRTIAEVLPPGAHGISPDDYYL